MSNTKNKGSAKKQLQGRDNFHRMNYLYQIANLSRSIPGHVGKQLMIHYGSQMLALGKKTNSRMEPRLKRTLCKGCNSVMVEGDTARARLLPKPQAQLAVICLICGRHKLFNLREGHRIWSDRTEAVVETISDNRTTPRPSAQSQTPNENSMENLKQPKNSESAEQSVDKTNS